MRLPPSPTSKLHQLGDIAHFEHLAHSRTARSGMWHLLGEVETVGRTFAASAAF